MRDDAEHNAKMKRVQVARQAMMAGKTVEKGLLIVHTGAGKARRPPRSGWWCARSVTA